MRNKAYYAQLATTAGALLNDKKPVSLFTLPTFAEASQSPIQYDIELVEQPYSLLQTEITIRQGDVLIFGLRALVCFYQDKMCYLGFYNDTGKYNLKDDVATCFPNAIFEALNPTDFCLFDSIFNWTELNSRPLVKLIISGSDFQLQVLRSLCNIDSGHHVSYSELAIRLGRPSAVRAVASAVGRNKISYFIPCHRVVRTDGTLGGFRWGLKAKLVLLLDELSK